MFALFVVVILAARSLAFRLVPESVLSLDSAFFVAATMCLGALPAGRMVGLALTIDALVRMLRRSERAAWREELAYVLYFGGMTGALLAAWGWLVGTDALVLADT